MCGHGEYSTRTYRQQHARQRRRQLSQAQNTTNNAGKHTQAAAATIAYAQKKMLIIIITNQDFICVTIVNVVRARTDSNARVNTGVNSVKRRTQKVPLTSTRRQQVQPLRTHTKKHMLVITIKNQKFTCVVMVNVVRARIDINVRANAGANSIKRNTASTHRLSYCHVPLSSEWLNTPG